jgi:hypothetical protein
VLVCHRALHLLTQPEHAIAHEPDRISKASRVRGEHGRTARVPAGAAHREQRREVEAAEGNSFKSLSALDRVSKIYGKFITQHSADI